MHRRDIRNTIGYLGYLGCATFILTLTKVKIDVLSK